MKIPSSAKQHKHERGIALFMAIFALMLLSAIAAGFMYLANTETAVNANYRSGQQAYFAARAGLQEGRSRITTGLGDLSAQAYAMTMPNAATKAGGIYITNPGLGEAASAPWDPNDPYFDDTICKGNFPAWSWITERRTYVVPRTRRRRNYRRRNGPQRLPATL
jgi:hypothetical protein